MKITQKLLASIVAMSALMPMALLPIEASAQHYNHNNNDSDRNNNNNNNNNNSNSNSSDNNRNNRNNNANFTPYIDGFNVDEVRRLRPGVELKFALYGTPGGLATLRIEGATRNLYLVETESGQYEGSYTINNHDRIRGRSPVTANLRVGNQITSSVLNESLQIGVGHHETASGPKPRINRFHVNAINDLSPGNELYFMFHGTPNGKAVLNIDGVRRKLFMQEGNAGEYATTYTIRRHDRIKPNSAVKVNLRVGDRITSATLNQHLQNATAPVVVPIANNCRHCGTVEAVNLIEMRGEGGYLGTIGGGVVGALLGSQIGQGNGRTAAEIVGAIGGAYAGRAIEGNSKRAHHYEVLVRFDNGASQTLSFAADPGYHAGDKVKVNDGVLSHRH